MIEINPKYEHIAAQDNMCVAACMQMVLQRRYLPYPSQREITDTLGRIEEDGLHIDEEGFERLFKKHNIALEEKRVTIYQVWDKEYELFIEDNIRKNRDMIVFYTYSLLFEDKPEEGHASLIEGGYRDTIILVDPNSRNYEIKEVNLYNLVQAMAPKGWFSIISKE